MDAVRLATRPDPYARFHVAQGYRLGDLVVLSGQASMDPAGNVVGAGDFDAQVAQIMANIGALLQQADSGLDRILKVTIYLTDARHFPKLIELRRRWFAPPYPADTVVEVSRLAHPDFLIELDVMALAGGRIG